ncbi:hypothetical protein [Streptomyces sp. NPDC002845]
MGIVEPMVPDELWEPAGPRRRARSARMSPRVPAVWSRQASITRTRPGRISSIARHFRAFMPVPYRWNRSSRSGRQRSGGDAHHPLPGPTVRTPSIDMFGRPRERSWALSLDRWRQWMTRCLAQARAAGEISATVPDEGTVDTLLAALAGFQISALLVSHLTTAERQKTALDGLLATL